jgi:predicted AAA+ superfamily ATPase
LNKKVYVNDTGLANTLLFKSQRDLVEDRQYRSILVENIIHNSLLNFKQRLGSLLHEGIPYWIDTKTDREIDFMFDLGKTKTPIEVKIKSIIGQEDISTIENILSSKASLKFGIVVTANLLQKKDNILYIPAYIFSLLL